MKKIQQVLFQGPTCAHTRISSISKLKLSVAFYTSKNAPCLPRPWALPFSGLQQRGPGRDLGAGPQNRGCTRLACVRPTRRLHRSESGLLGWGCRYRHFQLGMWARPSSGTTWSPAHVWALAELSQSSCKDSTLLHLILQMRTLKSREEGEQGQGSSILNIHDLRQSFFT